MRTPMWCTRCSAHAEGKCGPIKNNNDKNAQSKTTIAAVDDCAAAPRCAYTYYIIRLGIHRTMKQSITDSVYFFPMMRVAVSKSTNTTRYDYHYYYAHAIELPISSRPEVLQLCETLARVNNLCSADCRGVAGGRTVHCTR